MFSFEGASPTKCGGDSKEDPPVPMPNTEVKLLNADGTWWATARESRKLPQYTRKTEAYCFGFFVCEIFAFGKCEIIYFVNCEIIALRQLWIFACGKYGIESFAFSL